MYVYERFIQNLVRAGFKLDQVKTIFEVIDVSIDNLVKDECSHCEGDCGNCEIHNPKEVLSFLQMGWIGINAYIEHLRQYDLDNNHGINMEEIISNAMNNIKTGVRITIKSCHEDNVFELDGVTLNDVEFLKRMVDKSKEAAEYECYPVIDAEKIWRAEKDERLSDPAPELHKSLEAQNLQHPNPRFPPADESEDSQ